MEHLFFWAKESLYYVVYPSAKANPTGAQIVAGNDVDDTPATASGSATARETTGEQVFNAATGLSAGTSYRAAFVWYDGARYSNVVVTDAFETTSASVTIDCTTGSATASGVACLLDVAIDCAAGSAAASGITALLDVALDCTTGSAAASGATCLLDAEILCAAGSAAASGVACLLDHAIDCGVGSAAASGIQCDIEAGVGETIDCTTGSAAASGVACLLDAAIDCAAGSATASGVTADLDIADGTSYIEIDVPEDVRTILVAARSRAITVSRRTA